MTRKRRQHGPPWIRATVVVWPAVVVALAAADGAAQVGGGGGPCGDLAQRAFDFWIGDWDVDQEFPQIDGSVIRLPARSTVTREIQGCALLERWRGEVQFFWEGMTAPDSLYALSVRAWDEADGVWRIHWMDTRGPRRWVNGGSSGGFANGTGEFLSPPDARGFSSNRIRFFDIRSDAVEWELATRQSAGAPWRVIWRMHFRRR